MEQSQTLLLPPRVTSFGDKQKTAWNFDSTPF
jgi:hypothetical protein